jgi:GMP synthase-like glutamine amidotransferase
MPLTKILVVGGGYEYIRYLFQEAYDGATSLEDADVVLFTGGEDVSPTYYDEKKLERTFSNPERDRREKVIYDTAREMGKPMVGICRGGQFLNVMNGGKMWQHIEGHGGDHLMREILPKKSKRKEPRTFMVTSTHHQMMRPAKTGVVLAVGVTPDGDPICAHREAYGECVDGKDGKEHPDIEVVWYPDTKCLCFQPHPEYQAAPKECKDYFEELMMDLVVPDDRTA